MNPPTSPDKTRGARPAKKRRPYNSPLRRQQSARTRESIIAAGARLVHGLPSWDWKNLTARAVAERAGVSERTVHRYFSTERKLRDAVLQRLVEESGVDLDNLELAGFADTAARTFRYLSSFAATPPAVKNPSMAAIDQQRREALLGAVNKAAPEWSRQSREMAAALLDLMWHLPSYERLLYTWDFDEESAVTAVTWLIGLVEEAIHQDRPPTD